VEVLRRVRAKLAEEEVGCALEKCGMW
jgi:hypothetical protein